jgi:hypothetical protein
MKKENKRKFTSSSLMAFVAMIAKAWLWIIVAIIATVILGYVFYKVVRVLRFIRPVPPNQVDVAVEPTNASQIVVQFMSQPPVKKIDPGVVPFVYTMQYGISVDNQPWISPGMSMQNHVNGDVDWIVDSSDECWFTITFKGGQTFMFDYNAVDGTPMSNNNSSGIFPCSPNTVVIERTTNMVDWCPIFTNACCGLNTVEPFTDINGPPQKAFYRSVYIFPPTNSP